MMELTNNIKIPLDKYLLILDSRLYDRDYSIEYTKRIYDLDISNINNQSFRWFTSVNAFDKFNEKYPMPDKSNRGSSINRYIRFYKKYHEPDCVYDLIINCFVKYREVHHILPVCYGGSNELVNLIPVYKRNHNILHKNPLEHIEKYCFQAVDYLSYLWRFKLAESIEDKNLTDQFKVKELTNFHISIAEGVIEEEMDIFYKKIERDYYAQ